MRLFVKLCTSSEKSPKKPARIEVKMRLVDLSETEGWHSRWKREVSRIVTSLRPPPGTPQAATKMMSFTSLNTAGCFLRS